MPSSERESFYDAPGVHDRYLAHREHTRLSPNHVMEEPAFLTEVGDPAGLRILDLGCGDGAFGRLLLAAGARSYFGVDNSHHMVEQATRTLVGTTGRADLADIQDFSPPARSADLVTARLSLHYVADLDRVLATCVRALAPGGRLIMTVVHPVITSYDNRTAGPRTTWTVDDYFNPGPRLRDWMGAQVTWHHRTVENYVAAMTGAGMTVTSLRECAPDPAHFEGDTDEYIRRRRVPLFLLLSGRRPAGSRA
ncbi:SAM-dependent methyltransferase [Nakamurella sp. UYEF19]|uniref:class I SAM-dependent methyltransferase n=1 Tax=Nakamurella sp. UYEF19 TaxID=1756392 RepID=UPI00339AD933